MDRLFAPRVPLEAQLNDMPVVAAQPQLPEATDPWEDKGYRFNNLPNYQPLSLAELRQLQSRAVGIPTVRAVARVYMPPQDPWQK